MRGHNKPTPTCKYFENQPCDRPRDCPVHGPALDRPKKKRHLLRAELESFAPNRGGGGSWHRTLCGIYLHKRLEFGVVMDFETRQKVELSGFRFRLPPSTDPSYEVFLEVGYSHKEVLIITGGVPSCRTCQKRWPACEGYKFPEKVWDKTLLEQFLAD